MLSFIALRTSRILHKVKMSCRRISSLASANVKLTFCLLLLITLNVAATGTLSVSDHFNDDCSLVQCPAEPACPADSHLKATSEEIDDLEDYDDLATNNPFAGVHIEALLPLHDEHSAEQSQDQLLTETTIAAKRVKRAVKSKRHAWKRDLTFINFDLDEEESSVRNCCTDYECVCQECVRGTHWPRCAPNEVAVEFSSAQGTPGSCCASYVCVQQWQCTDNADANKHSLDDVYWKDACTRCVCFGGEELCSEMCDKSVEQQPEPQQLHQHHHHHHHQQDEAHATNCYSDYLEKLMFDGETWLEDGDCSECSCVDGEKSCITNFCAAVECKNPKKVVGKCCPVCMPEEIQAVEAVEQQLELLTEITTTTKATELVETTTATTSTTPMQSTLNTNSASVETETETLLVSTTNATTEATQTQSINATLENAELQFDTTTATIAAVSEAVSTTTAVDANSTTTATNSAMSDVSSTTTAATASDEADDFSTTTATSLLTDNVEGTTTNNTPPSEAGTTTTTDAFIYVDNATSTPLTDFSDGHSFAVFTNESSATSTTAATSMDIFTESTATSLATDGTTSSETSAETFSETSDSTSAATTTATSSKTTLATSSETFSAPFATSSVEADTFSTTSSATTSYTTSTKTATETTTSATSTGYLLHSIYSTMAPISPSFTDSSSPTSYNSNSSPQSSTEFFSIATSPVTSAPDQQHSLPTHQQRLHADVSYSIDDDDAFSTTTNNNYGSNINNNMNPVPLLNEPQNMHRLFDELGSMVVVALALGSLFCIALGLIIRYTKNKKKIYSSIDSTLPNSETSLLSENSTNTVLTV